MSVLTEVCFSLPKKVDCIALYLCAHNRGAWRMLEKLNVFSFHEFISPQGRLPF